ncbi:MAG: hypothetical protein WCY26_00560 [Thiohalobacteraceae bacterium]
MNEAPETSRAIRPITAVALTHVMQVLARRGDDSLQPAGTAGG